jgi:tetratricopeptide (TPR) repeat protein
MLPTSNVLFPIGTIFGERLAYLPSAGFLAAAAGVAVALPAVSGGFRAALLAVAVGTWGGATVARNEVFRDDDRLFADMVEKVPRSARARYNVAWLALGRGELFSARLSLERAVGLFPRYYDAWALLGRIAWKEKRWSDARADYREALRIKPEYENGWWGLAKVETESGRFAEADRTFVEGISLFPRSYPLLHHRAAFLHDRGRLEDARRLWPGAIAAGGGSGLSRLGLARTLSGLGREEEALAEVRRAIASAPDHTEARIFLAERYLAAGKALPAAAELGRAARGAPADPGPARLLLELAVREPMARGVASTELPSLEKRYGSPARNLKLRAAIDAYRAAVHP